MSTNNFAYHLPIAATLFLRCVSGTLVEDRQKPTLKPYGPVRRISINNPESRLRLLGLNKRIPGIRYKSLAAILGKSIVFHSIDLASRKGLRAEWRSSREICFGPWGDLFEVEFEQFLSGEMLRSLPC
ncbi:hypothetical protein QUA40_05585 [Microcoleus sp. Pol11C3]|uniref:hypothetical protein n=1 Tax=Microcoleus sp. Pol11C3 TaxID=3055390 RepID=UPI002FD22EB8